MSKERVIIGADAGCGRKDKLVIPFYINYPHIDQNGNKENITISSNEIKDEDFYSLMRELIKINKLPKTSGVITKEEIMKSGFGEIIEEKERKSIVFVSTTSKHSGAFDTATKSWEEIMKEKHNIKAEVIDSQQVSEGMGFLIDLGKELAGKGATQKQIKKEIKNTIPRIVSFISLKHLGNLVKGGRVPDLPAYILNKVNSLISYRVTLQLEDGQLKPIVEIPKTTVGKAWNSILERAGEISSFEKIAIVHANYLEKAQVLAESLGKVFDGKIIIAQADLAVAVHAGEEAIGFFGLKKK